MSQSKTYNKHIFCCCCCSLNESANKEGTEIISPNMSDWQPYSLTATAREIQSMINLSY